MNIFNIYVHFLGLNDNITDSIDNARNFIRNIQFLIDRADCEKGTILFIDNASKDAFLDQVEVAEFYLGTLSFADTVRKLFNDVGARNWEENPLHDANEQECYYRQWISANFNCINDFPVVLKEIAEKTSRIRDTEEKCLLLRISNDYPNSCQFFVIKDTINGLPPIFLYIDSVSTFADLEIWFEKKRVARKYNMEDNRHIENHPNYGNKKSPLLGGIGGKQNAATLLITALGDPKETKDLINFDDTNMRYIWYEYEVAQNQYHGYHLAKPQSHEKDFPAEDKIPERVKALLEFRRGDLKYMK